MTLEQSWLIAKQENRMREQASTIARLDADNKRLKALLDEMLAELLDAYDGYDRAEATAYWKARLK